MLIHAQGWNRGNAPVKIYHVDVGSGCVLVGDAITRVMLDPDEIRELYRLLEPFVQKDVGAVSLSDGDRGQES